MTHQPVGHSSTTSNPCSNISASSLTSSLAKLGSSSLPSSCSSLSQSSQPMKTSSLTQVPSSPIEKIQYYNSSSCASNSSVYCKTQLHLPPPPSQTMPPLAPPVVYIPSDPYLVWPAAGLPLAAGSGAVPMTHLANDSQYFSPLMPPSHPDMPSSVTSSFLVKVPSGTACVNNSNPVVFGSGAQIPVQPMMPVHQSLPHPPPQPPPIPPPALLQSIPPPLATVGQGSLIQSSPAVVNPSSVMMSGQESCGGYMTSDVSGWQPHALSGCLDDHQLQCYNLKSQFTWWTPIHPSLIPLTPAPHLPAPVSPVQFQILLSFCSSLLLPLLS